MLWEALFVDGQLGKAASKGLSIYTMIIAILRY